MEIQNEIDGLRSIIVKLTQLPYLRFLPSKIDPQEIIGLSIESLEAVFAVTICNIRNNPHGGSVLHLNHRTSQWFVLTIGYRSREISGCHLSDCQRRPKKQERERTCCRQSNRRFSNHDVASLHAMFHDRRRSAWTSTQIPMYSGA